MDLEQRRTHYVQSVLSNSRFSPRKARSLSEQIADDLADDILKGLLRPGERIAEIDVAKRFNVSRGPVKTALHELHKIGVVEMAPRKGARVVRYSKQDIRKLYDVRAVLTGLNLRLAALAEDKRFVDEMEVGIDLLEEMAHNPDVTPSAFLEVRSAVAILAKTAADNRFLDEVSLQMEQKVISHGSSFRTAGRRLESVAIWRRVVAALRAGDCDAAEAAGKELVRSARDALVGLPDDD